MNDSHNQNGNGHLETPLWDPAILERLDPENFKGQYKDGVSPLCPGESLHIRPLNLEDFKKGYLDLLKELTSVGNVSQQLFEETFNKMKSCENTYYVTVIEDLSTHKIVGSATMVLEQKFIHGANTRGRVEDVVVSDSHRGKQLGKVLVDVLIALSRELGCYKVSLECKDHLTKFYSLFGLEKTPGQNFMQLRFFD